MDVLISWSKSKSQQLARALREWLPTVLPGIKPWMSEKDIDKGTEWFAELQTYLAGAKSCVIIVTEENVRSPWLYYEAGAIATKGDVVRVCPYLVGVSPGILSDGPLGKFQCTAATEDDSLALIQSLNKSLASPHDADLLKGNFERKWPKFDEALQKVIASENKDSATFVKTEIDQLAGEALSSEARELLLAAVQDERAIVFCSSSMQGLSVGTRGKQFSEEGNTRSEATWRQAVDDLVHAGLLRDQGHKGEVFGVTDKGFTVADRLSKAAPHQGKELDDNDIISILESYLAKHAKELQTTSFEFATIDQELDLKPGSTERLIEKAGEKFNCRVRRKGKSVITFDIVSRDYPEVFNPGIPTSRFW